MAKPKKKMTQRQLMAQAQAVCRGMEHGGGFMQALALAIAAADSENVRRIHDAFPEEWAYYRREGLRSQAEDQRRNVRVPSPAHTVLEAFVNDVNMGGGLQQIDAIKCAPVADPTWTDLGPTYLNACAVLGVRPVVHANPDA